MKLQSLLIVLALAAGTSFAQAPNGSAKAPADAPTASPSAAADPAPAKATKKKASHKKHSAKHASGHHQGAHMANAHHHHGTQAMGAGAAQPATDLGASGRQQRMDSAYADWGAKQR